MRLEQPYEKDDKAPIIGPASFKEHGFRMLMIWASGLNPDVSLIKELCEALSAVDKKAIAGIYLHINPVCILFRYIYTYNIYSINPFLITIVIQLLSQQTPYCAQ